MMTRITVVAPLVALVLALGVHGKARAEIGTIDAVPAATLLLPYFEVDLNDPGGVTTLFSVNNASASSALAHVTLWTDQAVPSFNFDIYLTGYDVQTINLRDILAGHLPVTADDGADVADNSSPATGISNQGLLSQDINFPGSTGPCGSLTTLYDAPDPTLAVKVDHLRKIHTGQLSPIYGGCSGSNYGDNVARGYVTVDSVTTCNLLFPSDAGYFSGGFADARNILWGDYFYVNSAQNFAQGDPLVHVEACIPGGGFAGPVGNGAGHCPVAPGDYTFYGRYAAVSGQDTREPLATTFVSRYLNGGSFTGGTDLVVWRDTKVRPTGTSFTHNCASNPGWFPLAHTDVVGFDEQENATDLCFLTDNVAPVIGGGQPCFPLATQRVDTNGGNVIAPNLVVPATFGMLYLNLNFTAVSDPFPGVAQAWVTTVMDANGRFSVGYPGIALDNALTANPGGTILIP